MKIQKNRNRWILLLGPLILYIEQIYGKNRRQKFPATLPFQLREGLYQTYTYLVLVHYFLPHGGKVDQSGHSNSAAKNIEVLMWTAGLTRTSAHGSILARIGF